MPKDDKDIVDGGYGFIGNMSTYIILNAPLTEEDNKHIRDKLKEENEEAYEQYLLFEKEMK